MRKRLREVFYFALILLGVAFANACLGASVASQAVPVVSLERISEADVRLNGIAIGDSKADVLRQWGRPLRVKDHPLKHPTDSGPPYKYWEYPQSGTVLFLGERVVHASKAGGNLFWNRCKLPSSGSSLREVFDFLGPAKEESEAGRYLRYEVGTRGSIGYWYQNDVITEIDLGVRDRESGKHS